MSSDAHNSVEDIEFYYNKPLSEITLEEIDAHHHFLMGQEAFKKAFGAANKGDHYFDDEFYELAQQLEPEKPFRLQTLTEFAQLQTNGWLIKSILPRAQLVVMYGAPGSGKTFAILDMAMAIARDNGVWHDHKVKPGKVVYICAEAPQGLKNRIIAYAGRHNIGLADIANFQVIPETPNFLLQDNIKTLCANIGKADMVVVDTMACIMAGGDENSGKDTGLVIARCKEIHAQTGATVVLIHHSGKDADKGSRGWSGLLGAVDTELKVEKIGIDHKITVTKQKEGESGLELGFTLTPVVLGLDEDGDDITSCTFEPSSVIANRKPKEESLGGVQKIIMEKFDTFPEKPVLVDDLLALTVANIPHDVTKRDQRRTRFFQSLDKLQTKGILSVAHNLVYKA